VQKTAQSFLDEDAFLSSTFFTLENDVVEHERRTARTFAIQNETAIQNAVELHNHADIEDMNRQAEDVIVLDTVIETQQLLQDMVS
jgi:hypothetical protein